MDENKKPLDEKPLIIENSTIFSENTETDTDNILKKSKGYGKTIALLVSICVVIAVAITCTLLFWKVPTDNNSSSSSTNEGIVIIKEDVSANTVSVKNPKSQYSFKKTKQTVTEVPTSNDGTTQKAISTEKEVYLIQGYDKYNMDAELTTALVEEMLPLTASQKVTGTWTDSELGLDNPIITVKIDDITLSIGKSSGMSDMHYCKVSGDDNRYLLANELCENLMQTPSDFVNLEAISALKESDYPNSFQNGTLVDFDYINISGNQFGNTITIKTLFDVGDISSFAVTQPKSFYADMNMVSKLVEPFASGFNATGCYELVDDKTDLSKYGLDKPQYIYDYSFEGKKFKISISKLGVVDKGVYALRVNDGNIIYKINADSIEFLIDNVDDLRSTVLFSFMIKDVNTFTVNYGNTTHQYNISMEDAKDDNGSSIQKTIVKSTDGKTLDAESFQNIYLALANISPSSYTESGAEYTNPAYMTITLKMNSGKVNTVKFIRYNDRYYRMYVNGIGDQLINYTYIDRLKGYFDDFAAGKSIASPSEFD